MLDGVDNNETWLQTVVIFPSVDALDEFKMQTSDLLGGVRPLARRRRQPADQVGHQQLHGSALRVPSRRRVRRQQLLQQPRRPREAGLQARTSSAARSAARSSRTRRSSSATTRATARRRAQTRLSTVPTLTMRSGRLLGTEPDHLRPDDRPAVPGQHHSRRSDRPGRAQHPRTSSIPSRTPPARGSANGQIINNYLINPIKTRQDNQFDVKVDHNLTHEQPVLRPLQLPEDAPPPAGDAAARRRRRHLRRRRRQHQGAGPRVQRHAHVRAEPWLNEFRFGWIVDQVLHDRRSTTAPTRPTAVGLPGHQPQRGRRRR